MKDYLKTAWDEDNPEHVSVVDELPLWSAPFGLKLLERVAWRKGVRALDLGCGTGFPLVELAERLGRSGMVYGVDPWERALERCEQKLGTHRIHNVKTLPAKGEELPFPDDFFDLIVSNNGINNVVDLGRTVLECGRVARPGAQALFTMNTDETFREFYALFREALEEAGRKDAVPRVKEHIRLKRPLVAEVWRRLEGAGFLVTEIVEDEFKIRFADGGTMLRHHFIRYWFIPAWLAIPGPRDADRVFDRVEAKLDAVAERDGCVELSVPFVLFDCRYAGR